jgi:hypothetical protein
MITVVESSICTVLNFPRLKTKDLSSKFLSHLTYDYVRSSGEEYMDSYMDAKKYCKLEELRGLYQTHTPFVRFKQLCT